MDNLSITTVAEKYKQRRDDYIRCCFGVIFPVYALKSASGMKTETAPSSVVAELSCKMADMLMQEADRTWSLIPEKPEND
jgi:hypothetical protein